MYRTGFGYDIHALAEGRELVLGGIKIPFHKGLLGHSDADVLLHAIIDSLLGAAAMGDIGTHFPDTSEEFKDYSSAKMLEYVVKLISDSGYKISNIDTSIVIEKPKIQPYITNIKQSISKVLKIDVDAVSIKAKTNEGFGDIGNNEAVAAYANCLIYKLSNSQKV